MRILIVEDEPTLGKQLKSTLEGAGYAVDLSTDGEDGHYMGSTENYDAVILGSTPGATFLSEMNQILGLTENLILVPTQIIFSKD
jgi:DNA-binding response OmpR family regulator